MNKSYRAKIVSFEHGFYQIETEPLPDENLPRHILETNLRGWQIDVGLGIGDYGRLVYHTTFNSGLWYLVKSSPPPSDDIDISQESAQEFADEVKKISLTFPRFKG